MPADITFVGGHFLNKTEVYPMRSIEKKLFCLSIVSFLFSSITIWLMPLTSFEREGTKVFAYLLAAAFWVFLILGFVFQHLLSRMRKRDGDLTSGGRVALLRFFSNRPFRIFDSLLIAGAAALFLTFLFPALPGWITQTAIFMTVFSLEMHGVFGGRNYTYLCKTRSPNALH